MQNAETWANDTAWRPALAGGPGSSPAPIRPMESQAGSAEGQGSGAPAVHGRGRLGRSVQKLGRGWRAGRTDGCSFTGWTGGPYSRQVQSSQCNGFLQDGGPLCGPQRSPGRCRKGGRAGPDLVFALAPGARQVLRAPAEDAWASGAQQAFSCHRLGCTPFRETRPPPARPANRTPLSLGQVPSCWDPSLVGIHPLAPNWSSGHEGSSIPQRPPYCPHPRASGSLAQGPAWRGVGGESSP